MNYPYIPVGDKKINLINIIQHFYPSTKEQVFVLENYNVRKKENIAIQINNLTEGFVCTSYHRVTVQAFSLTVAQLLHNLLFVWYVYVLYIIIYIPHLIDTTVIPKFWYHFEADQY